MTWECKCGCVNPLDDVRCGDCNALPPIGEIVEQITKERDQLRADLQAAKRQLAEKNEALGLAVCSPAPSGSTNPIDSEDSFGLEEIIKWAAWVDHTEGTEVSSGDKAICIAHAILEASCAYEPNNR